MYLYTWVEDNEVLKFQRISAKHFDLKNQIKSMFATHTVNFIVRLQILFDKFAKTYYSVQLGLINVEFIEIKINFFIFYH